MTLVGIKPQMKTINLMNNNIKKELQLYKFIVKNNNRVRYELIKQEFGEDIWILIVKLKREHYVTDTSDSAQYIKLDKLGMKRYRKRHYLRFSSLINLKFHNLTNRIENWIKFNNVIIMVLLTFIILILTFLLIFIR